MEQRVTVHLEGFQDPLVGRLIGSVKGESLEKLFGRTTEAQARLEGTNLVVNHEEQYSYTVEFQDPLVGRRLEELFREARRVKIDFSLDGHEMKIAY